MEELLQDILKETNGPKLAALRKSCQNAIETLSAQDNGTRSPSHEIRRSCLAPLQIALETKRPKLVAFALNGFHKLLRDDRFHRGIEPEDDSLWMPAQLLCATASVMFHPPDTQVHIFRLYLSLALSPRRTLNGRLAVWTCGRCGEAAASAPPAAAAARAAAAQTLRAYCLQLDEEYEDMLCEGSPLGRSHLVAVGCYSEVIPVTQYLCGRISEAHVTVKQNPYSLFYVDCLLTLMSSLPERVSSNTHFTTFLWQKFCPALISFLGTPRVDKNIKSREHEGFLDDSGRGSGALVGAPSFNCRQAKAVYSIANHLVRLIGPIPSLRPVLEALYHRMLLYPALPHRAAPLRATRALLSNPRRLYRLALPSNPHGDNHSDDMAIIRLIMDAVEECARSGNPEAVIAAVECTVALLESLQKMCTPSGCVGCLPSDTVVAMLKQWPNLTDADYTGPLTYQSLARLPSPYRDVVAGLQGTKEKDADSSDTSGPENTCSDAEPDSDADNVFLPSRAPCTTAEPPKTERDNTTQQERVTTKRTDSNNSLPKTVPKTLNVGRCTDVECNVDLERHSARQFVKTLQSSLLPKLFSLRTGIEVDEAMQDFASKCCQHNAAQPPTSATIMNADGIYLATYAALLLNLKLMRLNYYNDPTVSVGNLTEKWFVEEVQNSGAVVYLSATWLRELYQRVVASDLLRYNPSSGERVALICLLVDLGGLDETPVMSDWQRLKEVSQIHKDPVESAEYQASLRWARRILTCVWDSVVSVLGAWLAGGTRRTQLRGMLRSKLPTFGKRRRVAWETLTIQCLEGLHKAARVSNTLGLQSRCSNILALLADCAVCRPAAGNIFSAHALSLDMLISGGLELGSKAPECWEHIFTACQYVSSLEHSLFGQQGNTTTPIVAMQKGRNKTVSMLHSDATSGRLGHCDISGKDDETCVDVFNFLQPTLDNAANDMSVAKIIESCQDSEAGSARVLRGASAARACCALAAAADTMFGRVADTSTLPVLKAALTHLTASSHRLLFSRGWPESTQDSRWWQRGVARARDSRSIASDAARALSRTGDVALRCLRAARPLAHRMVVWGIVGPHFMQAACHKDTHISSLAIQCMYDAITCLLNQQIELPHFHFNEALLKPFENLLCLELCDSEIQEQIIACICEFVETNRMEIRSGWRPLFNTLRAANNSDQYSAILEIFKVFLETDNTLVFANAALDCILCLLGHIKGLQFEDIQSSESTKKVSPSQSPKTSISNRFVKYNKFIPLNEEKSERVIIDMCKESLYYLESCADILTMMYNMPKCPIFNIGNRIKADAQLAVVDPIIFTGIMDITKFINNGSYQEEVISYKKLSTSLPSNYTIASCLLKLDKPSNILKVWYALMEGLISATVVCSKNNQPAAMETLFKLFRNIIELPGTHFGLHCINHILLPMVQNWLRQIVNANNYWDSVMPNFRQCCGMTTDTVVLYLHNLQQINAGRSSLDITDEKDLIVNEPVENVEVTFALKQIMLILVECIAQPQEPIARLGASCIRHIILTSGHLLTDIQWEIVCTSLHRACNVSLTPLKQLTYAFKENSNSFYGDLAIVKVAARRDCSVNDNVRLHAMSQQVFLNDQLRGEQSLKNQSRANNKAQNVLIDDRSYIFLVYLKESLNTLNPDLYMIRIPHRGLVVGLLAHQILVQIIATVLIQASSDVFHGINNIVIDSLKTETNVTNYKFLINSGNVDLMLRSLELSYNRAMQFDARPGLKFLVQKVSNLDFAANLYKLTTSSWLIKIIALTEYFFGGVEIYKLKLTDLVIILNSYSASLNMTLDYDRFVQKIFDLKQTWELICTSYASQFATDCVFDDIEHPKTEGMSSCSSEDHDVYMKPIESFKTQPVVENFERVEEPPRPFTFADFKKNSIEYSSSTNMTENESNVELNPKGNSSDDVMNVVHEEKETFKESPVVCEEEKERNKSITVCDGASYNNQGRKAIEPLIPPQPVPLEIEQQRILSITKDAETRRSCYKNILMAYLELILTFPLERFEVIYPVLQDGFLQLSRVASDPQVLDRVNTFFNRKDMV